MWEYSKPLSSDELYHFGVPGMKWGVRREIGKLAREHAILSSEQRMNTKSIARTENRIERKKEKGKSTLRSEQRLAKVRKANRRIAKTMKKHYSSLSPADIAQGKRSLLNRTLFGAFLAGPSGAIIGYSVPSIRAHRKLNA